MKRNNKTRQIGGLLLEALMLVFVFAYSWTDAKAIDRNTKGELTISASPVEQLVFRDSDSASESLVQLASKAQLSDADFNNSVVDLPGLEIANSEELSISQTLYNTFYTNTTTNAP